MSQARHLGKFILLSKKVFMLIQHKMQGNRGAYFIEEDGNILAEIIYTTPSPDRIIIEHTEVGDELRGQSIGFQLVNHLVEHARINQQKVIVVCPFARSIFDKKPDFQDVLAD
jgi:uncharacterized protein